MFGSGFFWPDSVIYYSVQNVWHFRLCEWMAECWCDPLTWIKRQEMVRLFRGHQYICSPVVKFTYNTVASWYISIKWKYFWKWFPIVFISWLNGFTSQRIDKVKSSYIYENSRNSLLTALFTKYLHECSVTLRCFDNFLWNAIKFLFLTLQVKDIYLKQQRLKIIESILLCYRKSLSWVYFN